MGRRYYQYIAPTSIAGGVITWPSTFTLAQMSWTPTNLTVENPPDLGPVTGVTENSSGLPTGFALNQNYPNPFNPSTVITYSLPKQTQVRLEVFNILGQKVASLFNQVQTAGTHSIAWNAQDDHGRQLSSGIYMLRMQADAFSQVRKMVFTK